MDCRYCDVRYVSTLVMNNVEGFVGYELVCIQDRDSTLVARVLYWDACGQFFVEMFGSEVPLTVLEELIAEVKGTIKTG